MNVAVFQDVEFGDDGAFDDFKMVLQFNHQKIAQVMFNADLVYATYPLIDNVRHTKDWQQNLQQELSSIYHLLGLTGLPDFSGADLDQEGDFQDFMQALCSIETRVNAVLGIV
jgi:hypothetical protein